MNAFYVICGLGVVSLIAEIVNLKKWLILFLIAGVAAAAVLLILDWNTSVHYFHDMLVFDNMAIAFTLLICVLAILWFWMTGDYFSEETHLTDHAALILFCIAGGVLLTSFSNMAMLFLGIEILSITLYVLAGSKKLSILSNEAAFKYFLMGSFATGFLLMGIALIYGATGSFQLSVIHEVVTQSNSLPGFFYAGVTMMLIAMAFKISAVPFHFWAPDVYEGSPSAITAFMSTIVKVSAFAAFMRLFGTVFNLSGSALLIIQGITVVTLVVANFTAVFQSSVKRMLAFSSVGHAGYVLLAFSGGVSVVPVGTVFYYLAVYAIGSLGAFAVLIRMESGGGDLSVQSFNGLYKRNSFLAIAMTVALLSLAGIPPMAGFFGKYLVFTSALDNGQTWLVIVAVITSLIGVYYYFRVIIAMFMSTPSSAETIRLSASDSVLIFVIMLLSIILGVFPDLIAFLH